MKEYALFYRNDYKAMPQVTPEQMAGMMQRWRDWIDQMKDKGQLVVAGSRLERDGGKVVKANNVTTDGPYVEIKETLGGYSVVKAESLDAAADIAKGCPILMFGGNVEVRQISTAL